MNFYSKLLIFLIFSIYGLSLSAQAIESYENLVQARKIAEEHSLRYNCGKILVDYPNGRGLMDYCSAVMLDPQTVLSVSHIYYDGLKHVSNCLFFFRNYEGKTYSIDFVRPLGPCRKDLDPNDDLALFYLRAPRPCPVQIKIATDWPQNPTQEKPQALFSLSYGWSLESKDKYQFHNTEGKYLYYKTETFETIEKTYIQEYWADRAVYITQKNGHNRDFYLAKPGNPSQIFIHDSGSPWFTGNEVEGYTLCGLSCSSEKVRPYEIHPENLCYKNDFFWFDYPLTLQVYTLKDPRRFRNQLTAVAPHSSWIEQHRKLSS